MNKKKTNEKQYEYKPTEKKNEAMQVKNLVHM
jgi:hypothetical protein